MRVHGRSSGIRTHDLLLPRQARYQAALCSGGVPGEIRTPGLLIRSQALYPAELRALLSHNILLQQPDWLGRKGSNLRMTESKSVALPLGYSPTNYGVSSGNRTHGCRSHNPVRYPLRHTHHGRGGRIRTHDMRFWRPPFYQLNYAPIALCRSCCIADLVRSSPSSIDCKTATFHMG